MFFTIGADFVPTESNAGLFAEGSMDKLLDGELLSLLGGAAYRIFNLEIPLTDKADPIVKYGPNLMASANTVKGYQSIGVNLLTLANNHILDQGVFGLQSTMAALDKAGIAHLGAGETLSEAEKSFSFDFAGRRIGVYSCAEHEFSIASKSRPGANPFDPLWSLDHVYELKKNVDYVIVLYHGGKEHYRYPSPYLQKVCRRLVDKGADLVICQHSHCIGCEEKYNGGTIVYGQGNFLFDHSENEYWQTGLLVNVDDQLQIKYIPLMKRGNGVRIAVKAEGQRILKEFMERSKEIKEDGFVEKRYAAFSNELSDFYLFALSGRQSLFFKFLNKLTRKKYGKRYLTKTYSDASKSRIINYVSCEAHRELMLRGLENELPQSR